MTKPQFPMTNKNNTFKEKVLKIVAAIPRGKTLTYGEVAKRAGNASAARAVGAILKTNYDPKIPCHRVIRSDGTLGDYNRGAARKRQLLKQEGAMIALAQ
jgi:methylated-DNA-[protein]-cysteine S-methyltransferase